MELVFVSSAAWDDTFRDLTLRTFVLRKMLSSVVSLPSCPTTGNSNSPRVDTFWMVTVFALTSFVSWRHRKWSPRREHASARKDLGVPKVNVNVASLKMVAAVVTIAAIAVVGTAVAEALVAMAAVDVEAPVAVVLPPVALEIASEVAAADIIPAAAADMAAAAAVVVAAAEDAAAEDAAAVVVISHLVASPLLLTFNAVLQAVHLAVRLEVLLVAVLMWSTVVEPQVKVDAINVFKSLRISISMTLKNNIKTNLRAIMKKNSIATLMNPFNKNKEVINAAMIATVVLLKAKINMRRLIGWTILAAESSRRHRHIGMMTLALPR